MDQRRSVDACDDIWRIEMKFTFPGLRQLRVAALVSRSARTLTHFIFAINVRNNYDFDKYFILHQEQTKPKFQDLQFIQQHSYCSNAVTAVCHIS